MTRHRHGRHRHPHRRRPRSPTRRLPPRRRRPQLHRHPDARRPATRCLASQADDFVVDAPATTSTTACRGTAHHGHQPRRPERDPGRRRTPVVRRLRRADDGVVHLVPHPLLGLVGADRGHRPIAPATGAAYDGPSPRRRDLQVPAPHPRRERPWLPHVPRLARLQRRDDRGRTQLDTSPYPGRDRRRPPAGCSRSTTAGRASRATIRRGPSRPATSIRRPGPDRSVATARGRPGGPTSAARPHRPSRSQHPHMPERR